MTRDQRIEHFRTAIFGRVEGWLGERMPQIVDIIGGMLEANNVHGHIAEFGVHHGLFLFLLNTLRADDEECFAIDVFEDQQLNIDHSGYGTQAVFLTQLETLLPAERSAFRLIQRDTLSFSSGEFIRLFGDKGAKFFSIDAGHTAQHAFNDLTLVQEVLAPGGVAALDDFMKTFWPGVTEGFYRFMNVSNRRLKPFLYFQNKLFLTTISEHQRNIEQARAGLDAVVGEEIHSGTWKYVEIAGAQCLTFWQ